MKLEAIREDRTRGGRSTYQCSYTIPAGVAPSPSHPGHSSLPPGLGLQDDRGAEGPTIPPLLQDIMNVEHLWFSSQPHLADPMPPSNPPPLQPQVPGEDILQTLTIMADQRLYKLVKWCKSLPLFKNILVSLF